jgi:hypothetical protein
MRLEASRVVPRLIELLDKFAEYDPDFGRDERVVTALTAFCLEARPAISKLAARIWDSPEEYYDSKGILKTKKALERNVVTFLGSHGKAAAEALLNLVEARTVMIQQGLAHYEPDEPEDKPPLPEEFCPDFLKDAIERIQDDR